MPARNSATQKLVDACLRAPRPVEEIAAPPREVTAAAKSFSKFDAAQRLAVIPILVRHLGLAHDWPELDLEEMRAFTAAAHEARPSHFLPISVAMLFGTWDGKIPQAPSPRSLDAFNRGLAIMASQRFLERDQLRKDASAYVPTFPDTGAENERIIAACLELETSEHRGVLLAFVVNNERWEIFDALEKAFAQGRGELKNGDDVYLSRFPAQKKRVTAYLVKLGKAALKGREVLKPIWEAEGDVSAKAKVLFERSPAMKKRFGDSVWWGHVRSRSTSANDIAISIAISRKVHGELKSLGAFAIAAQRKGKGPWKFSQLDVQLEKENIKLR